MLLSKDLRTSLHGTYKGGIYTERKDRYQVGESNYEEVSKGNDRF